MLADNILCTDIRPLLSDFIDGETTTEESARIETHILGCAECASQLAFLRFSKVALGAAYPLERPSYDLSARIAQATYARPTLGRRIAELFRPAPVRLGLGTALAAGVAAVLIVPTLNRPSVVPPTEVAQLPAAPDNTSKTIAKPGAPVRKQAGVAKKTSPPVTSPIQGTAVATVPKAPAQPVVTEPVKTERSVVESTLPQVANLKTIPFVKKPSDLLRGLPKKGVQNVATISSRERNAVPPVERGITRAELPFRHINPRNLPRPEVRHSTALPTPTLGNMPLTTPEIKIPDESRVVAVVPTTPVDKPETGFSPAVDTASNGGGRRFRMSLAGSGTHATPGASTTITARPGRQNASISEGASYALVSAPVK